MTNSFTKICLTVCALAFAGGACSGSDENKTTAAQKSSELQKKADEAQAKVVTGLKAERDSVIAKSTATLIDLDARILVLETRAGEKADEATKKMIADIRTLRAQAQAALDKARASTDENWAELAATLDAAIKQAEATYAVVDKAITAR